MWALPQNKTYRAILVGTTVALTVAYAWMGARMMAPSPSFPPALISHVAWLSGGQAYKPEEAPTFQWLEFQSMRHELKTLAPTLDLIGGMRKSLRLIINMDEPRILRIDDSTIEAGYSLAQSRGQLGKAVVKAWLLQNADISITGSMLRLEAVSDALLAMLNGSLELASPVEGHAPFSLTKPENWLAYAGSIEDICTSEWTIPELQALCLKRQTGEGDLSSLSFRPLIGDFIFSLYQAAPSSKKLDFLQAWAAHLKDPKSNEQLEDFFRLNGLKQWRDRLRQEIYALVPNSVFALSEGKGELLARARLLVDQDPQVDLIVMKMGESDQGDSAQPPYSEWREKRARYVKKGFVEFTAVGQGLGELKSGSGKLRIPLQEDDFGLKSRLLAWESCDSPTLKDLMGVRFQAERALVVENCGTGVDLLPLRESVQDFALWNPKVAFVQLRISGVKLAIEKGLVSPQDKAMDMLKEARRRKKTGETLDLFGLNDAKWTKDLAVFKPLGAIEAIEWYRPKDVAKLTDLPSQ